MPQISIDKTAVVSLKEGLRVNIAGIMVLLVVITVHLAQGTCTKVYLCATRIYNCFLAVRQLYEPALY